MIKFKLATDELSVNLQNLQPDFLSFKLDLVSV